jgi:alkylation response protein AidB-like acyl-CoA dehydrogenase
MSLDSDLPKWRACLERSGFPTYIGSPSDFRSACDRCREDEKEPAVTAKPESILSDELLKRIHERAPVYDRENRFFTEDFEDLKKTGYLKMPVPREYGGLGLPLSECARQTRRLAY